MNCKKCGTNLPEGNAACPNCGAPAKKSKLPWIIGGAVAVLAIVIALLCIFGGKGYEEVVGKYIEYSFEGKTEQIFDLMPEEVVEAAAKEGGMTVSQMKAYFKQMGESTLISLNDAMGAGWTYSYVITGSEKIKGEDLEAIKAEFETVDLKVSKALEVDVEVTLTGSKQTQTEEMTVTVVKIGTKWYLASLDT